MKGGTGLLIEMRPAMAAGLDPNAKEARAAHGKLQWQRNNQQTGLEKACCF